MTQADLALNIEQREIEVVGYETNYNNYTLMIEEMGDVILTESLKEHIGKTSDQLPMELSLEEAQLVSDYNYLDKIKKLQRSELLEMNKVKLLVKVLNAQVDPNYVAPVIEETVIESAVL